jgi:hypothetical protein
MRPSNILQEQKRVYIKRLQWYSHNHVQMKTVDKKITRIIYISYLKYTLRQKIMYSVITLPGNCFLIA